MMQDAVSMAVTTATFFETMKVFGAARPGGIVHKTFLQCFIIFDPHRTHTEARRTLHKTRHHISPFLFLFPQINIRKELNKLNSSL